MTLFEDQYLQLGVYTRMDNPIYAFGFLAWIMESVPFVLIFFRTRWSKSGLYVALKYSRLMAIFTAASSIAGAAAKIHVGDLSGWFLLSGSFVFLHFTLMGLMLALLTRGLRTDIADDSQQ